MAFLETSTTTMYYDIFEPDLTSRPLSAQPQTVLLIHGFGGTPTSDFGGQLPALRIHFAAGGVIITDKELASIRCPALLMHGKRDRIIPAGCVSC